MSKKIVVFTVTGIQGSSVARSLLKDEKYTVVGITRNPDSQSAKALATQGVQLAKGDLQDPSTYKPALQGAYGAFVNADFWTHYLSNGHDSQAAYHSERKESQAAIEALVQAGVKQIVYSSLDDFEGVPHFQSKAHVSQWAREHKYPVTNLVTTSYISNLVKFKQITKDPKEEGTFVVDLGTHDDGVLPLYAPEQTGAWALAAFINPDKYLGQDIHVVSEITTPKKIVKELAEVTGKKFRTRGISREDFYNDPKGLSLVEEQYVSKVAFDQGKFKHSVEESALVNPDQWDVKAWAANSNELKAYLEA